MASTTDQYSAPATAGQGEAMTKEQLAAFLSFIDSFHAADRRQILNYLACSILNEQPGKHPVFSEQRQVAGFLLSAGEYLRITESESERAELLSGLSKLK